MFQTKLRRALVSAVLVSALSLLPAHAAAPRSQRSESTHAERNVAVRLAPPIWELVNGLLAKVSVRIDPNGNTLTLDADPNGNEPSSQPDRTR